MIRPATRADVVAFYGKVPPQSFRAWVFEQNGEVKGLAGYWFVESTAIVFSDQKDMSRKDTVRGIRFLMDKLKSLRVSVIAASDNETLLNRLGFVREGDVWRSAWDRG